MDDSHIVVVGAGLAGLVAARHLAVDGADVTVIERRDDVGGRVRTRTKDGFTLDRGFQVLLTGYPAVRRELDFDALDLRPLAPGATICRPSRRSVLSDPLRDINGLFDSLRNPEVTTSDKLRTLALRQDVSTRDEGEIFDSPDQSIRAYLRDWGFSEDFIEHFVAPFYGGITLDRSLSTSKRVFEYTFKMLATGRAAVPADGMQAIPEQLAATARDEGATIRLGERVESVQSDADGAVVATDDESVEADAVVVATDPKEARRLTGVGSIPTDARGCVTQYYTLPTGSGLDAGKRIMLNAPNPDPNTVVPLSTVAPEYAPPGKELLNATFLGAAAQDESEEELFEKTRRTLEAWYPERYFDDLELLHTDYISFAQFAQPPEIHDSLPDHRDAPGRTYLAGDYTAWSSIQGAMRSGKEAADAIRDDLST
ncbi:FAD-dependent oxidoreductase [Haloferax mediterranei ATCC 33500]|uniref:FAD-dependent oxidoreductase n=1 Tax=Haloferax mediterranei (strain ATCC 33500 / DSM 1411 / JCM 8866 / NBRC 14739 / NCIMB 2177 / R-4) TaxID=523841 RepID=I3R2P9_HALMT|nr:NAD(P)/FAD-dependent oxidoreductase [Haloferax mediterranei]AFK18509.1 phytoene dehydrogenase (phytoene desaturase) [Haloferax mediterranei ATCC 33500]AHZ22111.1 phytoene dehydrogenase [Haloferax mediterranei ATCC 33500]EMA02218.1 phytoene dehydrogenase (phytoene desaturase) [Haloferax mediterranei ATCC 33500]MDX5988597.1 NAD(P)/FAD-dependent oxidoreductase [Haloferax mediterranei ATCC 33500]QCQ75013.1 FAD-dependent oxidoreductase [Haloferax mediterranei ATCC 33500]